MPESNRFRLIDLLPAKLDGLEQVVENDLRERKGGGHSALAWRFIRSTASDRVHQALDCDGYEWLAWGWSKAQTLREYCSKPPDETSVVHLGKHDFRISINPVLELGLGGAPGVPLRFTLEVAAHFDAAALSIRNGCIFAVDAGRASATAQLLYGSTPLHKKEESPKVQLPGSYRFKDPGIRIGGTAPLAAQPA
ncbi:MAG TPA: hypothetical protein VFF96_05825 [Pseudoxanthomonas sp.]|nr:hypothetical protein [Pseudoxanthomonas sp.]